MENQKPDYQDILKRIYATPSILFLGQNYLSEVTSESSKNIDEAQYLLDYREILSLRWNTIVSSSFDANIPDKCGESFPFEVRSQYDKSQEISKTIKTGYFLFGQGSNSKTSSKPDFELDSSSKDTFSAILKKTIDSYGIVIISGWDLDTDWINPQILYDILKNAPAQSVLFFGIEREKALKNKFINALIDKKRLLEEDIIEDAFYFFLQRNRFFDAHFEEDNFSLDSNVETLSLYSINYKDGRNPYVLRIQKDTIYEFNSKSITLITDTTGVNTISNNNDNLLRFCACKGDWSYYAPHNKLIINRKITIENNSVDFYESITRHIEKILRKGKKKNTHCICVTGIHYSGKTALLKNFALRNKNIYPIFYVENYVDGVTEKLLSDFCDNSINMPEEFSRGVVVICDFKANSDSDMQRICQNIKNTLSEISGLCPVVIGTTYSDYEFYKNQLKIMTLSHQLNDEEFKNIQSVYNSVGSSFRSTSNNESIFQIILKLYRFSFSPEAADLRVAMKNAHSVNQTIVQRNVNEAYGQIYEDEYNVFIKLGILSSFDGMLDKDDERKANLKKLNDCIALASEFGIELPDNFILRTLGWNNYKFLEALRADCFLIQKENSFRYISAYEAGKYLLFNYTDDSDTAQNKENKLKEKEVEILCTIIEISNWNDYDEESKIISLIRKFSPNSIGKDANIIGNNDINSNPEGRKWHYYDEYYEQIGKKILECAKDSEIAVIVASAFLRRAYQALNTKSDNEDLIITAYNSCKSILDNHTIFDFLSKNEKIEVYIEICNVIIVTFPNRDNPSSGNFDKWDEFIQLFQCLVDYYDKTDKLDASVILSIWHRAVIKRAKKQDIALFGVKRK